MAFAENVITVMTAQLAAERLPMWVIYDHPTDHPDGYIARAWYSLPEPEPMLLTFKTAELETLRQMMREGAYTCLGREPGDDSKIVETWLV